MSDSSRIDEGWGGEADDERDRFRTRGSSRRRHDPFAPLVAADDADRERLVAPASEANPHRPRDRGRPGSRRDPEPLRESRPTDWGQRNRTEAGSLGSRRREELGRDEGM